MQKPFILIDNAKNISNLITWVSISASKTSDHWAWRLKQKLQMKSVLVKWCPFV